MNIDVLYRPAHSLATVDLATNETVRAEASAMVSMSTNIQTTTQAGAGKKGGLFKSLKRRMLGGESFFTNTFTPTGGPGRVTLAPRLCGDMVVHELDSNHELFIQGSAYVGGAANIDIDTKFQGMKGLFSGESLFFLRASGTGPVLLSAFGGIETIDFDGELIVDTGHLVAFTTGIEYAIKKASSGLIASFLSGEGLVLQITGRGTLYLQTRNPGEYGKSVGRQLPARKE